MIKFVTCILIISGCTAIGFIKAYTYKARRIELENTLELVRMLELEIAYKKDSLKKIFERISSLKSCWFSQVLKDCGDCLGNEKPLNMAWHQAIRYNSAQCPLLKDDIEILKDVSMGLGKSDIKGQKQIIEPAVAKLESKIKEAKNAEIKSGKMYRSLGIATGIVIAVIFL